MVSAWSLADGSQCAPCYLFGVRRDRPPPQHTEDDVAARQPTSPEPAESLRPWSLMPLGQRPAAPVTYLGVARAAQPPPFASGCDESVVESIRQRQEQAEAAARLLAAEAERRARLDWNDHSLRFPPAQLADRGATANWWPLRHGTDFRPQQRWIPPGHGSLQRRPLSGSARRRRPGTPAGAGSSVARRRLLLSRSCTPKSPGLQ
eukprot:TRINITY_DN14345_c0_g1_i1.p2 TRINITY_DN14345_c0_g1~~TRINITY_DN14345_c0_g1_i1.p2  ORF type:complete len:205 (+),score=32.05 TRINITY_DN14345_c0_g1_i1:41-655(+)